MPLPRRGGERVSLPEPECRGGYTASQIDSIVSNPGDFWGWMGGQTMMICQGESPCTEAHGMPIVYPWDLQRYLDGGPIID